MGQQISDEVRRFVLTNIPSVPYPESMLLLRAESHSPGSPPAISCWLPTS
jgi:hypothetical protein